MDIQARQAYQPLKETPISAAPKPVPADKTATQKPVEKSPESFTFEDRLSDDFMLRAGSNASSFDPSEVKLPTLDLVDDPHRFHGPFVEEDGRKLNFYHGSVSTEKALLSIEVREPRMEDMVRAQREHAESFGDKEPIPMRDPKIRSPFLKQWARDSAENLIRNPIEAAWENKTFTPEAGRATLIAGAIIGTAIAADTDTKFSTRLMDTDFGGHDIRLKAGMKAGHGGVGMRSVGLSIRPQQEAANVRSGYDLKYDFEDDSVNFSYSRTVDYGGNGHHRSIGRFNASIYHDGEKNDTGARMSYHINF